MTRLLSNIVFSGPLMLSGSESKLTIVKVRFHKFPFYPHRKSIPGNYACKGFLMNGGSSISSFVSRLEGTNGILRSRDSLRKN